MGGHRQMLPPRARWTPEERLADMDSLGVDVHVVSPYVGFYNYELPVEAARASARPSTTRSPTWRAPGPSASPVWAPCPCRT